MLHGCLYLSTNTSFTYSHLCSPAAPAAPDCLQLLCWEDRVAHRLQFSVVTSNPDAGLGHPPPGGSLLFNAASARVIQSISLALKSKQPSPKARGTSLRSRMSGLKSHPRSSSEPRLWSIFTCFPHTKMWSVAHAFGKTCLPSRLSSRFVLRSRLFEMNFEVLGKAERAALHLHFCILKWPFLFFQKADYSTR